MRRHISFLTLALAALLALPVTAFAQEAQLVGYVRSDAQAPVAGAVVSVLNQSIVTNDQGSYLLVIPADQVNGQEVTITVSSIGYSTTEVTVTLNPGTITQNIIMPTRAVALDEIIVTGAAGRLERRAQAAQVSSISTSDVTDVAPITTVSNILQARTPGLMMRNNSGTSGTYSTIRIRGISSMSGSNSPLVYIDGIRADGGQGEGGVGGQSRSRLNDIKPEDIETIEVVKGPAAATLYGSDAVAGVINIITKRGRTGSGFTQTINVEYGEADPNFRQPANYGECTEEIVNDPEELETYPACAGVPAGTVLSDRPLEREGSFINGQYRNLVYQLRGGGETYDVFFTLGADDDQGTLPNNKYSHVNARTNVGFLAAENLRVEVGFGLTRINGELPTNDNNIYGYLGGGLLGDPRTVGAAKDGWYASNRHTLALENKRDVEKVWRIQPRASATYTPWDWFSNRLTVGADMQRREDMSFYAKNDDGWWDNQAWNTGRISQGRDIEDRLTMDYLGTVTQNLTDDLRVDLSFGTQWLAQRNDGTSAQGTGLVSNAVNSVSSAAELTGGGQSSSQSRDIGILAQADISWQEKLYLQAGVRRDQSSAFGIDSKPFVSPKVGLSYVIGEEAYFQDAIGFLPDNFLTTLRLRGAYGVSGRQPNSGARSTFDPSTNQISPTDVAIGVRPDDTGNPTLKAEKSEELELGFDAGLFGERVGIDFTYFNKKGVDQILSLPVPSSIGTEGPDVNIGSLRTWGTETELEFRPFTTENVALELYGSYSTLSNKVLDLGGVPESATRKEGLPLNGQWDYTIREVDLENNRVIVSDTLEYQGPNANYPGWQTTLSSTLTLFERLAFYAQMDGRGDVIVNDGTQDFRDRSFGIGGPAVLGPAFFGVDENGNPTEEARIKYMRRFGPFVNESGQNVERNEVEGDYDQDGTFFRLREASVRYRIPEGFAAQYMRARSASIGLTMRNLHTWTDFTGLDPESGQFLTVPADQRWTVRMSVNF